MLVEKTVIIEVGESWNRRFVAGCQMVQNLNGGLKTGLKKPINGPKWPVFEWSTKSRDFTIWIPDTFTVWYSDESGIQMFGILMVTRIEGWRENPYKDKN